MTDTVRVSPPTRGWTPPVGVSQPRRWFPRPRGDGPTSRGYSAGRTCRFPRPRGDGPIEPELPVMLSMVSPPTRGWTLRIDEGRASVGRFPRPRGDGPLPIEITGIRYVRFPRPRGDGPCEYLGNAMATKGFPAHAGMDPVKSMISRRSSDGFPAHAGMDPVSLQIGNVYVSVSPPTRGWTLDHRLRSHPAPGFPAHAGMDRISRRGGSMSGWFPRPRGDGPATDGVSAGAPAVSPPTRGWTPVLQGQARRDRAVSPPTRGWTHDRGTDRLREGGFPAHAGMDP